MRNAIVLLILLAVVCFSQAETTPSKEAKLAQEQAHKFFAVELNNQTWGLLTKENRTEEDNNAMILSAYGSLYHWSIVGESVNLQRGEWLVSHVWSVLGKPESAVYHAERCWKFTKENDLQDFDLAYAHEALARAYACAGKKDEALKEFNKAETEAEKIADPEDAKIFIGDLNAGPWYEIK
ncbi:hypothetical protein KAH81_00625 [bacterium]|nr:hypothetical protein [bacterium]